LGNSQLQGKAYKFSPSGRADPPFQAEGTMLTRDKLIQLLQREHAYLNTEFGVSKIGLFGSYAKGQPGETSDIDILVEFERPIGFRFLDLVDYLEAVLGCKVDVLTPAGVQNIRIDRVAKSIAESIVYV
jgi:predicted nucleotidyltransferase